MGKHDTPSVICSVWFKNNKSASKFELCCSLVQLSAHWCYHSVRWVLWLSQIILAAHIKLHCNMFEAKSRSTDSLPGTEFRNKVWLIYHRYCLSQYVCYDIITDTVPHNDEGACYWCGSVGGGVTGHLWGEDLYSAVIIVLRWDAAITPP